VFAGSYSALSAPAARLFRLLGLHPGPDIDTTAACALAGTDATRLRPAMTELTSAHLVLEHRPGRYTFHDLLREYAAELVRTAEDDAQRRAAERRMLDHYVHSAHAAARRLDPSRPPRPLGPAGAAQPAPYRTHEQAMAWFEAEHPVLLGVISYAAVCGHDAETTHLAWSLVDFVSRRGHWRDWLNTQTLALQAARRLGDLGEQASTHMCLARAYTTHGEHDEALVQLRQALGLAERLGDRTRQAHIHINISIVFDYQHRYAEALRHDYEALEHYAAAGHAEGRAYSLNNIGCCLTNLGRPADALAAAEQAMILVRDGEHHELIAAVWDTLGYAHYHLHDHARAVDCYEHALALYRDIGDRYEEAKTLVHLGDAHHAAGESGVARAVWQQALIVLTELDHPDAETLRAKMAQPLVS
jgi:tetratricopeptide (TPR) repeat protein